MSRLWLRLTACLLVLISFAGYGQKPDIYGKWYFDRFGGPHGEIVTSGEIAGTEGWGDHEN